MLFLDVSFAAIAVNKVSMGNDENVDQKLTVVAAAALIDAAGRVLMQRRPSCSQHGGLWEFPGGKREPGETLSECARIDRRAGNISRSGGVPPGGLVDSDTWPRRTDAGTDDLSTLDRRTDSTGWRDAALVQSAADHAATDAAGGRAFSRRVTHLSVTQRRARRWRCPAAPALAGWHRVPSRKSVRCGWSPELRHLFRRRQRRRRWRPIPRG
jgi:hypothetical protein